MLTASAQAGKFCDHSKIFFFFSESRQKKNKEEEICFDFVYLF